MVKWSSNEPLHHRAGRRRLRLRHLLVAAVVAGAAVWLFTSSRLPSLANRSATTMLVDTGATRLGKAIAPLLVANPGASGIYPLPDAREAFAARALMAQAAERTLDVQYYIWRGDMTGALLLKALHSAAERGVRVRLLLDDNGTSGLDAALAALDAHANVEVRLFNPFVIRAPRWIGYATDFSRLNRRMHNKSFTADNQATIIGGRNIGDEYFEATERVAFADLDVIAVGPVVNEVSVDFDRYWSSASSYPVGTLLPPADATQIAEIAAAALRIENAPAAVGYMNAMRDSTFVRDLMQGDLALEWAPTRMISDDPAKGLGLAAPDVQLLHKLKEIIGESTSRFDLVSPYFVPTAEGVEAITALTQRGVKVRVLTNSLEATDVAAVHAGYAKRRAALLDAGVVLHELRRLSPDAPASERAAVGSGSSGSSLHAKTFSVDRLRVFVGSFNFDPRSATLNTELGFLIESPALAQRFEAVLNTRIPASAYEVRRSDAGQLYWIENRNGTIVRHDIEPGTTFWKRAAVSLMSVLPIEWLL